MQFAPSGAPRPRSHPKRRLAGIVAVLATAAVACGGGAAAGPQVASLGTDAAQAATATTAPASTEEAILAYAACMRENGIDMADPTFDADGNPTGGLGFGPESGIDPRSDAFQAAQDACGDLMQGVTFGGRGPGGFDREAMQAAFADFTACLRDQGLDVDDVTFGDRGGPGANGGATSPGGSVAPGGSVPGGFQGGPPPDGADGQGFDPTTRLIDRLGLDADDPAVSAALGVCQPALEAALQPTGDTTQTTQASN